MFGIGFSELLLIAVLALLFMDEERIKDVACFAGKLVFEAKKSWRIMTIEAAEKNGGVKGDER